MIHFEDDALERLAADVPQGVHFIVDERVTQLYRETMAPVLAAPSVLALQASEHAKSLERMAGYVEHLVAHGVRRDHVLVAVGGGVIQDITCFLAATLLRGVAWRFYPTTLLAQADSCMGSKSSINAGIVKNILGTFTPPAAVHLSTRLLSTLAEQDIRSGIGEILKVHAISGPESFARIARDYPRLFHDRDLLGSYIRAALAIKKPYVETDEFDTGPRNIFNYGHSFGHAIEAASDFGVPHGIAVTIGMDMANFVSAELSIGTRAHFERMHPVLLANFKGFETYPIPLNPLRSALGKDKKNVGVGTISLILPDAAGRLFKGRYRTDARFSEICRVYVEDVRGT